MYDARIESLERRIAALESRWADADRLELERGPQRVEEDRGQRLVEEARARHGFAPATDGVTRRASTTDTAWRGAVEILTGEGAVARLGSALLVLGALYGVKYGIDRGWIVEEVRVAGVALLGLVLLWTGHRLRESRRVLSDVLSGAGVASLYVAIFAAQALYAMIPFWAGAVLMSAVTVLSLGLAQVRQTAFMAILATFGGLATPFILQSEDVNIPGLVAYVSAVLIGAGWMYLRNGWRSVILFAAAVSLALAAVILTLMVDSEPVATGDRIAVQVGLLLALGLFVWLPVYRTRPGFVGNEPVGPSWLPPVIPRFALALLPGLTLLVTWGFEHLAWEIEHPVWGIIGIVSVAALVAWYERLWGDRHLDAAVSLRAGQAWLLALAVMELAWDRPGVQLFLFAAVAFALVFDASRRPDRHPLWIAASLGIVVFFWFMGRTGDGVPSGFASLDSVADLGTLGLVAGAGLLLPSGKSRGGLLALTLAGLLAVTAREFADPGTTTAVWAVIAIGVLVGGYRFRSHGARIAGLAVLALVVGKLLLFDLASTDPLVRILIFLGVGGTLVTLSYLFPALWSNGDQARDSR